MRSVVVTGAASGIGLEIARELLASGWVVVGVDISEPASLGRPPEFRAVVGDVQDGRVLEEAAMLAGQGARLTAWVNNAALMHTEPLHLMSEDLIQRILSVDLQACVIGARIALNEFLRTGTAGSIVNISSIHAKAAWPGTGPYDIAKAGLDALTRYICVEYGHLGLRANSVAPGAVDTRMSTRTVAALSSPRLDPADLSPMRRASHPREIAQVVDFLLSGECNAINGHVLAVDNGMSAWSYPFDPNPDVRFETSDGGIGHGDD